MTYEDDMEEARRMASELRRSEEPVPPADYAAWDEEAIRLGHWKNGGPTPEARAVLGPRPMGPSRKASSRCESGKRDYCTCDTCF